MSVTSIVPRISFVTLRTATLSKRGQDLQWAMERPQQQQQPQQQHRMIASMSQHFCEKKRKKRDGIKNSAAISVWKIFRGRSEAATKRSEVWPPHRFKITSSLKLNIRIKSFKLFSSIIDELMESRPYQVFYRKKIGCFVGQSF